jgi:uncharacterized protein (TIGR00730 family)
MKQPAFSVCVYCGSRPGAKPDYAAAAQTVGRWIGEHDGQLVYGGGNNGLMGMVAQATLDHGGRVVGVIPKALEQREHSKLNCTELHVVDTMHQRKQIMAERANAFLALPGGIGTFEELFEVWTWNQLGYHDKPLGLLNVAGYYDSLLAFMRQSVEQGFLNDWQLDMLAVDTDPLRLLPKLVQDAGLTPGGRMGAV